MVIVFLVCSVVSGSAGSVLLNSKSDMHRMLRSVIVFFFIVFPFVMNIFFGIFNKYGGLNLKKEMVGRHLDLMSCSQFFLVFI